MPFDESAFTATVHVRCFTGSSVQLVPVTVVPSVLPWKPPPPVVTSAPSWKPRPSDAEGSDDPEDEVLMAHLYARMRQLIERGWTRGTPARDQSSHEVEPESPRAVRFCMLGAVERAVFDLRLEQAWDLSCRMREELGAACPGDHRIVSFNDSRSTKKGDVLALIDRAAGRYKK